MAPLSEVATFLVCIFLMVPSYINSYLPIFLNILNLVNHRTLYLSLIMIPSLFSYASNITGLIRDRFLLRFDLLFWDEVDKKYANLEEPDPII